jgi:hypothetical protein
MHEKTGQTNNLKAKLGGFVFSISCGDRIFFAKLKQFYRPLKTDGRPDIFIEIKTGGFKNLSARCFISREGISAAGTKNGRQFFLSRNKILVWFDSGLKKFQAILKSKRPENFFYFHLNLLNHLVSRSGGGIVHACGINLNGKGLLFIAPSGGGKTTMGRLCGSRKIINDDTVIVSRRNGEFMLNPFPWSGRIRHYFHPEVVLSGAFFLDKAKENSIRPMDRQEAVRKLFRNYLPPLRFNDGKSTDNMLNFNMGFINKVPCFNLGFKPTRSIVRAIKEKTDEF